MTSNVKVTPPKGETLEMEGTELPLLDLSEAAVKELIRSAKKRRYVTHDQINASNGLERCALSNWQAGGQARGCAGPRSILKPAAHDGRGHRQLRRPPAEMSRRIFPFGRTLSV